MPERHRNVVSREFHETEQFYSKTSPFLLLWVKRNEKAAICFTCNSSQRLNHCTSLFDSGALSTQTTTKNIIALHSTVQNGWYKFACMSRAGVCYFSSTIRVKKCYQDNRTLERYTHLIESKAIALLVSPEQDRCQGFPDAAYRRTHPR